MASVLILRTGMRLVPAVMARPKLSTDSIQPAWTSRPLDKTRANSRQRKGISTRIRADHRQDRAGTLPTSRTRLARPAISPTGTTKRGQAIAPAPSSLAELLVKLVSDIQTAAVSFPGGIRRAPKPIPPGCGYEYQSDDPVHVASPVPRHREALRRIVRVVGAPADRLGLRLWLEGGP